MFFSRSKLSLRFWSLFRILTPLKKKVTIIGGGLAGISLGIGLRKRGIPVRLFEAGQYPRHRVCGEFISGVSEKSLRFIGIEDVFDGMPRHRSTAWYYQGEKAFESALPTPAVGVSRYKLDKDLIDRFEAAGGELFTGTRFTGDLESGQVYATGRARQKGSQWIGIKCHLLDFPLEADLEMHVGEGSYLGLSAVEDNRVDACGLFTLKPEVKAPRLELMSSYLEACGLGQLAERVRTARKDESSCLGVNAFELGWQPEVPGESDRLRIGDRFAIIGPFSGNGMSMAFEGAATAIEPLEAWSKGDLEWKHCREIVDRKLKKLFRRRIAVSNLIHPFLTKKHKQKLLVTMGKMQIIPYASLFRALR